MAVVITWADSGGSALADPIDEGSVASGTASTGSSVFIEHNGKNPIKGARLYISPVVSGYTGAATAQEDYDELLEWGDATASGDFGGVQVNMDISDGTPGSWPTYSSKDPDSSYTIRTGVGDTFANGLVLSTDMSTAMSAPGIVPASSDPWPEMEVRIEVPANEGTIGKRHVNLKLRYTYTS